MKLRTFTATAAAVSLVGGAGMGAAQAAPMAPSTSTITKRADIDGDGRTDRLTVRYTTFGQGLQVTLSRSRGRSVSLRMPADLEQIGEPSVRVGDIDGARGAEIVVTEAFGDIPHYAVLTWRGGKLVRLDSPGGHKGDTWTINPDYEGQPGYWGYSFGTSKGVRTATTYTLSRTKSGRYFGPAATYRWTPRGWRWMSTTKVSLKQSQARAVTAFGGVKFR